MNNLPPNDTGDYYTYESDMFSIDKLSAKIPQPSIPIFMPFRYCCAGGTMLIRRLCVYLRDIGYEVNVVRDRFLNVGFSYIADELGKTCMAPNHVSNDTIYLDFLLKKKGDSRSSGTGMNCYDLSNLRYNSLIDYSKLQPKKDSICVTVTLKATTGIYDDKTTTDSRTVRISY